MNLISNGDFESRTMDNWYIHHGYVSVKSGKKKRKISWNMVADEQPPTVIVDNTSTLPQQANPIPPFEGSAMLRLNDLVGGQHVTCVHQDVTLPEGFSSACGYISFSWGALLGGSSHSEIQRPKFSLVIRRKHKRRWRDFLRVEYVAPSEGGDGWVDVRAAGESEAIWFKQGSEQRSLYGLQGGDMIRVRFVAEDCTDGGHGGAGFIDNVKIVDGCVPGSPVSTALPPFYFPNTFTPNDDGVNDVWGLSGVSGACIIKFCVFDRWGDEVYSDTKQSLDGVWPPFVPLWDGTIHTRRKVKGSGKRKKRYWRKILAKDLYQDEEDIQQYGGPTVALKLTLGNCFETKEWKDKHIIVLL